MIGKELAHYTLLEKIGEGGMGTVYKAKDTKLNRDVALKVLLPDMAKDAGRLGRFQREAQSVAKLNHPNIITLYSVESDGDEHFITMELVTGATLEDKLPEEGFSPRRFFDIALPLTDAVASAHLEGIYHRDLKPANIMINDRETVKILDFGLAKLRDELVNPEFAPTITAEGTVLGTLAYMAPEQIEGRVVDDRADIFSLGVIFYEMATGQRPFQGDSAASLTLAVLKQSPPPASEVKVGLPPNLSRIIRRCLEKDPDHRYATATELKQALETLKREVQSSSSFNTGVQQAVTREKGIVVLPFENLGNPDDAYFSQGITDEITSRLATVGELRVVARKSALQYADSKKSVEEIGAELDVDYIVDGTVRWARSGDASRVRISPNLTRVSDSTQMWGEIYDRTLDDIFEVQTELASEILDALGIALEDSGRAALEARPTNNVEAYDLYLRGRGQIEYYQDKNIRDGISLLEKALDLDGSFLTAYTHLAKAHSMMIHFGFDRSPERMAMAEATCRQAAAINPDAAETHLAWGFYHYNVERNFLVAEFEFKLAERDPAHATEGKEGRSYILRRIGKIEESERLMEEVLAVNPADAALHMNIAYTQVLTRNFPKARKSLAKAIEMAPENHMAKSFAAIERRLNGDLPGSRRILEAAPANDKHIATALYWQCLFEGEYGAALKALKRIQGDVVSDVFRTWHLAVLRGWAHHLAGDRARSEKEFETGAAWLEREIAGGERYTLGMMYAPLGIAYAGLGRKLDAVRQGLLSFDQSHHKDDSVSGADLRYHLAWVLAMAGEHDDAIRYLEDLLRIPALVTPVYLKLDPRWKSLRTHPRFQKLIEDALGEKRP